MLETSNCNGTTYLKKLFSDLYALRAVPSTFPCRTQNLEIKTTFYNGANAG